MWRAAGRAGRQPPARRRRKRAERGRGVARPHQPRPKRCEPASSQSAPSQRAGARALASVSPDGRAQPVSFSVNTYKTHF